VTTQHWIETLATIRAHHEALEPVAEPALIEAEARLACALPLRFKELLRQLGALTWPVSVAGASAVLRGAGEADDPTHLVFFGSDGGELRFAFDTRRTFDRDGYAVVEIDLEEGYVDEGMPEDAFSGFEAWLIDRVADEQARERAAGMEKALRSLDDLLRPEVPLPRPWCPSADEVHDAAARVGARLPEDYVRFCTSFGTVEWPLEIVDATGILELTEAVAREGCTLPERFVAIARDGSQVFGLDRGDGTLLGLSRDGGAVEQVGMSFLAWLRARVEQKRRQ